MLGELVFRLIYGDFCYWVFTFFVQFFFIEVGFIRGLIEDYRSMVFVFRGKVLKGIGVFFWFVGSFVLGQISCYVLRTFQQFCREVYVRGIEVCYLQLVLVFLFGDGLFWQRFFSFSEIFSFVVLVRVLILDLLGILSQNYCQVFFKFLIVEIMRNKGYCVVSYQVLG